MKTIPNESSCSPLLSRRWNPYLVGAGIGVLSMLVFWLADIGKLRLDQLLGIPVWAAFVILTVVAGGVFSLVHKLEESRGV